MQWPIEAVHPEHPVNKSLFTQADWEQSLTSALPRHEGQNPYHAQEGGA